NIVGKQNQPQPKNLSNQTSMELTSSSSAAAIVPPLSSRLSFLQPNTSISAYSIRTLRPTSLIYSRSNSARLRCQKMYVPGFGESPEGKAANYLVSFFTYIALEVVASQLQVRSAYSKMDFEWDNLKRLALKKVGDSNTRLMRDYVLETIHVDGADKQDQSQ
ncbi:Chaperonin-like RBCX protein 1, chloroplastic, partial [Linum perenne]